ncbi:MAG: GDYXXLXY domain-containing protein [Coriobacteriia bacterium]|nr:GDYXXLXY domain-containing protein [Coriobacteriia bacterium]
MKKLTVPALTLMIAVQLLTPAYMIYSRYDIQRTGEEYRFRVYPIDPYDAFRGKYVMLNVRTEVYGEGKYGIITVDSDGYAQVTTLTDIRPTNEPYITSSGNRWFSMPITRYYLDETIADEVEHLVWFQQPDEEAYVTVRVKNGEVVVTGLYIDGVAVEDIIRGR